MDVKSRLGGAHQKNLSFKNRKSNQYKKMKAVQIIVYPAFFFRRDPMRLALCQLDACG